MLGLITRLFMEHLAHVFLLGESDPFNLIICQMSLYKQVEKHKGLLKAFSNKKLVSLTFEFLVFSVIETTDFVRGSPVWIIPDILTSRCESVQAILDLNRLAMVCDLAAFCSFLLSECSHMWLSSG